MSAAPGAVSLSLSILFLISHGVVFDKDSICEATESGGLSGMTMSQEKEAPRSEASPR